MFSVSQTFFSKGPLSPSTEQFEKVSVIQEKDSLAWPCRSYRQRFGRSLLCAFSSSLRRGLCQYLYCRVPKAFSVLKAKLRIWKPQRASGNRGGQHREAKLIGKDVFVTRLQTLCFFYSVSPRLVQKGLIWCEKWGRGCGKTVQSHNTEISSMGNSVR